VEFSSLRLELYAGAQQALGFVNVSLTFARQRQQLHGFDQTRPLREQPVANIGRLRMPPLLQQSLSLLQTLNNRGVGRSAE
jgi:hypothetical protein